MGKLKILFILLSRQKNVHGIEIGFPDASHLRQTCRVNNSG